MTSLADAQPSGPPRNRFGPLRHRDYRLFWIGAVLSFIGSWVQIIAMGLLVYQMTGSKAALGLIGLVGGLPTTGLMLFGGVFADRSNKRTVVLVTQTVFGLTAFALAILTWIHQIAIWHIAALSFINGLVFAVDGPARQAMVFDLVGGEELSTGIALQSAAFNMARVIGPAVGSLLYAGFGAGWCFFINGVSFGAILIAIVMIRTDLTKRPEITTSVMGGLTEGLRYLKSNKLMQGVVSLTAVTSLFAFSAYSTLMPAFAMDRLRIGERDHRYGWLFSAIGFGSLIGVALVSKASYRKRRGLLMVGGANIFAIVLLILAHVTNLWLAIGLLVVIGLSAISQLATANTLTQTLAPDPLRGRAVSLHMFAMGGIQPFGAFLAGLIAQRWGVPVALTTGAVVFWVYTLFTVMLRPGIAKLE